MTLSDEAKAIETTLRDAGVRLSDVLHAANVNRATWTRWKNGSSKFGRYDTMSRVKEAASAAVTNAPRAEARSEAA